MPSRVSDDQLSLFSYNAQKIADSLGLDWWTVRKLYDDGWLSFDPDTTPIDRDSMAAELHFLGSLVAAGCDARMLKRMLEGLERPYRYDTGRMFYDWHGRQWVDFADEQHDCTAAKCTLVEELVSLTGKFAKPICQRITRRVIRELQQMTENLTSGEDSGLRNIWDEICVQVQFQESAFWELYDEMVFAIVAEHVEKLPAHERDALWLETPEAFDWLWEDEASREEMPVLSDDIEKYLVRDHIYTAAADWSNARIRADRERTYDIWG